MRRNSKQERTARYFDSMARYGIGYQDANKLRLIEKTLSRWGELECGDGNDYGSWCITRGRKEIRHGQHINGHGPHYVFIHDDDGTPFMEHHHYNHGKSPDTVTYTRMADREKGALKRLNKIMENYPDLVAYHQGDPRGATLWIVRKSDLNGHDIDSVYTRGIAACID